MPAARTALSITSAVLPPLAAEIGYRAWRSIGTPERVHERDRATHESAVVERIGALTTYRWGEGPRLILLVHGWRSRASRFAALVERLRSDEHTIVAFDAPGNGDSPGDSVTILDYAAGIRSLAQRYGTPHAVIGHSFGSLSAFLAVREGVPTRRLVSISGMSGAEQLLDAFSAGAGIRGAALRGLRRRIERRTFPGVPNPWRRFVAEIDPADLHVPLLLVHDADDPLVPVGHVAHIADAHTGAVRTHITAGLGHNRILRDTATLDAIAEFVSERSAAPSLRIPSRS